MRFQGVSSALCVFSNLFYFSEFPAYANSRTCSSVSFANSPSLSDQPVIFVYGLRSFSFRTTFLPLFGLSLSVLKFLVVSIRSSLSHTKLPIFSLLISKSFHALSFLRWKTGQFVFFFRSLALRCRSLRQFQSLFDRSSRFSRKRCLGLASPIAFRIFAGDISLLRLQSPQAEREDFSPTHTKDFHYIFHKTESTNLYAQFENPIRRREHALHSFPKDQNAKKETHFESCCNEIPYCTCFHIILVRTLTKIAYVQIENG